jgi:hypothetical protein
MNTILQGKTRGVVETSVKGAIILAVFYTVLNSWLVKKRKSAD